MAGYNLKEGIYKENVTDEDIWSAFTNLFSTKSKNSTSYKFGFMKALMDNLYNVNEHLSLSFNQIFGKFAEIYWNLVLKHSIKQIQLTKNNKLSALERTLFDAQELFQIETTIPYESLPESQIAHISKTIKSKCKQNVVGATFTDTSALLYSFSLKDEYLTFNPKAYNFMCKHKLILEKVNYFEWAKYLEKVNDEEKTLKLLDKLDKSSKRNNLIKYRNILFDEFENNTCFYCGKIITKNNVHVDHFIPWSFIKDDNLWNFVLSCPTCNLKKNDKLPNEEKLKELELRNNLILETSDFEEMHNYQTNRLFAIYKWAKLNGFDDIWSN